MLPGGLCHLKSIFNLSDLFQNAIFSAAKTYSIITIDILWWNVRYLKCSGSLVATPQAPQPPNSAYECLWIPREFALSPFICCHHGPQHAFTSILIPHFIWKSGWQLWLLSSLCVFVFALCDFQQHPPVRGWSGGAGDRQVQLIDGVTNLHAQFFQSFILLIHISIIPILPDYIFLTFDR